MTSDTISFLAPAIPLILQIASSIIALLATMLLGIIAWNVNRIYTRVDEIDKDLKKEAKLIWEKLDDHGIRISVTESRLEGRRVGD